ncbi:MAG TPA: hypothetical protein VFJ76_06360 [Solirubrobacterales bacterium]|nr:hypothetical protein [Solirubrobacterales bacterium]
MKRVGPELKMPDLKSLKVPPVLLDLYQDLRDRRLLPLVALILVAIVATPFLLGGGTEEEPAPAPAVPLEASTSSAEGRSLTVVEAQPGVRDYRKRLRHRKATNPFKPHYTGPVLAGTQLNGSPETSSSSDGTTSESSSSVTVESGSSPSAGSTPAPSGGAPAGNGNSGGNGDSGSGGTTGAGQLTFYAFAIDVKITKTKTEPDGSKSKPEEIEKERVLPPVALPGEKTQVVTYMGISPKTKKPLLLVSEEVESVFGETECLAGNGRCQLIEVEPRMPVTFVYGENQVRYKIVVEKIYPVPTGHS